MDIGAFLAVSLVVIVTPGQDTALTIKNALVGGRRGGVFTAIGVAAGQLVWVLATSLGLSALIVASEPLFDAIKLAGAAYLVFLGARSLLAAVRGRAERATPDRARDRSLRPGAAFRQGLVSNLANPKMAVFFTSLLPQFAPAGDTSFAVFAALGLTFCLLTLLWLTGYALVVARAGNVLRRPSVRRLLDAVTGLALVSFGIRLAAERRA